MLRGLGHGCPGMLVPRSIIMERVQRMPEFAQDAKKFRFVSTIRSTYQLSIRADHFSRRDLMMVIPLVESRTAASLLGNPTLP
jgi:hypothetical protein